MKSRVMVMFIALGLLAYVERAAGTQSSAQVQNPQSVPAAKAGQPRMEVVFVLDTTGSMTGMIASAKQKIWAIANKLKSAQPTPEIRFGLVAFRDRGDLYVTEASPLTDSLDDTYQRLMGMQADGGGDNPESVNAALYVALHDLPWSDDPKILRAIFLVGDAPPHMDYRDDVKYPESCRLAKQRGIVVNTLQCGNDPSTRQIWREIAELTGGTYGAIAQDGGSIKIETKHDAEVARLTAALNETIVPYGTAEERANVARNRALLARMSGEEVADRSSFLGKAEPGAVLAGKGDLVLEVMSDRFHLDSIDPEKLEPRFRNMFAADRDALILRLVEQRRALQEQMVAVLKLRDAEMAEKLKALADRGDVLELSAFQVLEAQATEKGFSFKKAP